MKAKEKAEELVSTFNCVDLSYQNVEPKEVAKKLALICVDEILSFNPNLNIVEFYKEVKTEIEKI